jgi:hypothetical protein
VVTFLDILGWTGIYNRHSNPLGTLRNFLESINEHTRGLTTGKTEVKSISDTVAILTPCLPNEISEAIESHGIICASAIPRSIEQMIPIRGATAAGTFENQDNAFIGKAVDEAASWYENSDWIGVHLTPSAQFQFKPRANSRWVKYPAPIKSPHRWEPYCVNWVEEDPSSITVESLHANFLELGPLVPEIAGKFVHTLRFFDAVKRLPPGQPLAR